MQILRVKGSQNKLREKYNAIITDQKMETYNEAIAFLKTQPVNTVVSCVEGDGYLALNNIREQVKNLADVLVKRKNDPIKNRRAIKSLKGEITHHEKQISRLLTVNQSTGKHRWFLRAA